MRIFGKRNPEGKDEKSRDIVKTVPVKADKEKEDVGSDDVSISEKNERKNSRKTRKTGLSESEKDKIKRELRKLHNKKPPSSPRNVNFYLLFLIIMLLVALVLATFYFFWKYDELLQEKGTFVESSSEVGEELNKCESVLDEALDQLEVIQAELNISSVSRESLNILYTNLSDVKEELDTELSNAQASLSSCQLEMQEATDELAEAIEDLNDYIAQYNQKEVELERALEDIYDLETENTLLENELEDLQDCVESNNVTECIEP